MNRQIPRLLFAAPGSGSGKTTVTCGFLRLCQKRGMACHAFKCGPDYIDPMFHKYVLNIDGTNLDSFFLDQEGVKALFQKDAGDCDLAVIEGVMGYYDGVAGVSTWASSYDIAVITKTPVVLVVDGKMGTLSVAAGIKGFLEYREDSNICGVILNRTSEMAAQRLRPQIEELGLYLAGWIPECEEARLESRHLGLTLPGEQAVLAQKLDVLAEKMEAGLDVEWLLGQAGSAEALDGKDLQPAKNREISFHMAVAQDEAFSFYYQENLALLEACGVRLSFFSPLHDRSLPEAIDGILFGGGYPEVYAEQLSENTSMLRSVRAAADKGLKIIAECGGFLYLHKNLEGMDGSCYPMAGLIDAHGFRTNRLSRFGYLTMKGSLGEIKGHEFHYWDSEKPGDACVAEKPLSERKWACIHQTGQLLAGFPHLYYPSNPEWIIRFLKGAEV